MASSSRPKSSMAASLRWTGNDMGASLSEFELEVACGGVDAQLDGRSVLVHDGAGAEISHAARDQAGIAAVTDAHPAAVRRVQTRLVGDAQEIGAPVAADLDSDPRARYVAATHAAL